MSERRSRNLKHSHTSRAFVTGASWLEFSTRARGSPYFSLPLILTARVDKDISNPRRRSLKSLGKRPMLVLLYPISRLPRKQPSKRCLFPIATNRVSTIPFPENERTKRERERQRESVRKSKERFNLSKPKSRRGWKRLSPLIVIDVAFIVMSSFF